MDFSIYIWDRWLFNESKKETSETISEDEWNVWIQVVNKIDIK